MLKTHRKTWIDQLRGLAVISVVLGHQLTNDVIFGTYIGSIYMPLFFAISGYLFNKKNVEFSRFFLGVFRRLIIPWFGLGILVTIPQLYDGTNEFLVRFKGLFTGEELWFMPCLVIGEIILYVLLKIKNTALFIFSIIICSIAGLIMGEYHCLDFLMINRALSVQFFFCIGIFFKYCEEFLKQINLGYILLAIIAYFILTTFGMVIYDGQTIDVHLNRYFNYPLNFITITLGCLICFCIWAKYNIRSRVLTIIGQHSLVIYIFHGLFIAFVCRIMSYMGIDLPLNERLIGIIKTIYACATCVVFSLFLNKYTPKLVGK